MGLADTYSSTMTSSVGTFASVHCTPIFKNDQPPLPPLKIPFSNPTSYLRDQKNACLSSTTCATNHHTGNRENCLDGEAQLSEQSRSTPNKENTGRWTIEEHTMFLDGLKVHGKGWKDIAKMIKTRTVVQIRTHAQKYFQKLAKAQQNGDLTGEVFMDTRRNPVQSDMSGVRASIRNSCEAASLEVTNLTKKRKKPMSKRKMPVIKGTRSLPILDFGTDNNIETVSTESSSKSAKPPPLTLDFDQLKNAPMVPPLQTSMGSPNCVTMYGGCLTEPSLQPYLPSAISGPTTHEWYSRDPEDAVDSLLHESTDAFHWLAASKSSQSQSVNFGVLDSDLSESDLSGSDSEKALDDFFKEPHSKKAKVSTPTQWMDENDPDLDLIGQANFDAVSFDEDAFVSALLVEGDVSMWS